MRQYSLLIGIGILALILVAVGLLLHPQDQFRGSVLDPPIPAPDFSLTQVDGTTFTLSAQKGKVVLLFFGYTYCPDVCPTTLADLAQVMKRIGKQAERVKVVFVSVDPSRDTPERAQAYAVAFDPFFIGLSGGEAELQPIWAAYGVYRLVQDNEGQKNDYLVDHSARVYLIDRNGNLRLTYSFGTPVDDLEHDLRLILREK